MAGGVYLRLTILCAALVLLLAPAEGDVQALQTFVRFGLDGNFSANCAEPASIEHPRMFFAYHSDATDKTLGILLGIATEKGTFNHLSGWIQGVFLSPDNQALTYAVGTPEGEEFVYRWGRVGERQFRLLSLEERTRRIRLVTDGIISATGIATPVYERCRN
jgi:hypothetical protein